MYQAPSGPLCVDVLPDLPPERSTLHMRYKLMSSIVIAAVAASASPAFAQDKRTEAGDMTAAISRDLGLSSDQVKRLGEQQERAIALDERLQKELGDGFAGSHFDIKSGQLIVN